MQKLIEELKNTVHEFIDQADDLFLVLSASDTDMPLVHKIIEGVDQEQPADIVLRFSDPSQPTGSAYADVVLKNLDAQIAEVNLVRTEKKMEPWPALPASCHDSRWPERQRVQLAMKHIRDLFPKDEDHRILWCFLPAPMGDPTGYASLVGGLLPKSGIEGWMHSQRIIARDNRSMPFLVPYLHQQKVEGTLVYPVDFSTPAVLDSMAREVQDPNTPEPQRMMMLLQLAATDQSYQRYPEAVKKYAACYDYFQRTNMPVQQAICLGGVGDCLVAGGALPEAKERYTQSMALAAPVGMPGLPVVMLMAAKTGDVCMTLNQVSEAEGFFDMASQIAGRFLNLEFKADCMEKVGIAREVAGRHASAAEVWQNAIGLCRDGDYFIRMRTVAERLIALRKARGTPQEVRDAETHLAFAEQKCKERYA
jgi:hypothetical protein